MKKPILSSIAAAALVTTIVAWGRPDPLGMYASTLEAKSFGAITFGPGNVLFVADNDAESVYALDITDKDKASGPINIEGIDAKVAQALGTSADQITIADMAVHPSSHNVYLSVMRGKGADAKPVLLKVTNDKTNPVSEVSLENIKHSSAKISNAPAANPGARSDPHRSTITDIAFADGKVWIAGLSNEQFSSAFRQVAFPFVAGQQTTQLQIYHVSHKRSETQAPVMTFAPERIDGKTYMLAAYTCTPLVEFAVDGLKDGQQVIGKTVADLGAGNQPADIIGYSFGGKDYMLIANRTHPMMKVSVADIASAPSLTTPDSNGITRVNVSAPGAVVQLSDFDKDNVIVVQKGAAGLDLRTIAKAGF
ncbi:MAG TPA: hypothetical protein VE967_05840 [Gemmatimonadaceae bacterium]|nr:hypothetical protein [Gemmatimonadaceae bacterium]